MSYKLFKFLGALTLALSATLLAHDSSASDDQLLKIPNGYQAGRSDATYGTYYSVVNLKGRSLQSRVVNLENRVMGFAKLADTDRVKQSEVLFTLEHAIFKLQMDIGNAPASVLSDFERESLLYNNTRTYQSLRTFGERLFEDMVRYIDVQLPGPNGLQLRTDVGLDSSYLPNYRTDVPLTAEERLKAYNEKKTEFLSQGGSLSEISKLDLASMIKMGSYTRVEYIVKTNGDIFVTSGKAGHILLAGGDAVRAAGQMVFIKNRRGRFLMAVVSNSSGSFKPDMFSVRSTADEVAKLAGLPATSVVLTKGEPISTQGVKVYSKGMGLAKDLTNTRISRLSEMQADLSAGGALTTSGAGHDECRTLFTNAEDLL